MLEIRHDHKPRVVIIGRGRGKEFPRDSVTVLLSPGCLQYQKHLMPQHWNHSSNYKLFHIFRPGFVENPFLYFLLPEEQALPRFLSQNYWQLDILSFTHSTEVIWIAKAFSLLFGLTLGFLQCESYFYTWRQRVLWILSQSSNYTDWFKVNPWIYYYRSI